MARKTAAACKACAPTSLAAKGEANGLSAISLASRTAKDGSGLARSTSTATPKEKRSSPAAAKGRGVAPTSASVSMPFPSGDSGCRGAEAGLAQQEECCSDGAGEHAAAHGGVHGDCHASVTHCGTAFSSSCASASDAASSAMVGVRGLPGRSQGSMRRASSSGEMRRAPDAPRGVESDSISSTIAQCAIRARKANAAAFSQRVSVVPFRNVVQSQRSVPRR